MCLKDDAFQNKVRATLNLIHTMSKALAVSATLDSNLANTAVFNCSEMILRAAIELHNDINAAIDDKGGTHDAV